MKYRTKFIIFTFIFLTLICFLADPSRLASVNSDSEAKTAIAQENQSSDDSRQQNNPADLLASGTVFEQEAKLLASDGAAQDSFSFSVAISGDTAVVGAPRNSGGTGLQSRGSAYVYVRSGNTWIEQQKLAPSDGATTDQFGYAVAINGNTIAVGRYNTTTGQNRADGKVYIFTRSGSVWTETQSLVSDDIAQGDSFGYALAFEGDTLAVGARNKQVGANLFQGAAYIFTRPSIGGNFTQQTKLIASDGGFADFFGESVALSGDTAVIGSVNDFGTANALGKAYVFVRNGSMWSQQQILQATGGSPNDAFGVSVSVSGDYALIGANTEPIGTSGELGAAYVFVRNGTVWTQQQRFTAQESTPRNDRFGYAVAIKGDTLAIGSPAHEFVSGIANQGLMFIRAAARCGASGKNFRRATANLLITSDRVWRWRETNCWSALTERITGGAKRSARARFIFLTGKARTGAAAANFSHLTANPATS